MAKLTLLLPASVRARPPANRMVIRTIDGKWRYNVRMAPKEVTYDGFGAQWSEVPVPGTTPFLVKESFALKKMSFELIVANPDNIDADMTDDLRTLKAFADTRRPIKIAYGGYFDKWTWRCTSLVITSEQRHPATSKITRATVQMEFTVKSDVADFTGPVTGGAKTERRSGGRTSGASSRKKTPKKKNNPSKKRKTRVYTMKRGDTLSELAVRFYGDYSRWRELADRNNIKDPRKIPVGKKIRY